jgi:hypothetical protein
MDLKSTSSSSSSSSSSGSNTNNNNNRWPSLRGRKEQNDAETYKERWARHAARMGEKERSRGFWWGNVN